MLSSKSMKIMYFKRYLVLPARPEGTKGLTQDELEAGITRLKGVFT